MADDDDDEDEPIDEAQRRRDMFLYRGDPFEKLFHEETAEEPVRANVGWRRLMQPRPPGVVAGYPLAGFQWRLASGLIDFIVAFVLPSAVFTRSWKLYGWWLMIGFAIHLLNGGVMAAWTGQSIGKKITKLYLVQERERDVGASRITYLPLQTAVLRAALHWLDAYSFIGFLLPYFWPSRRATIADWMVRSYVIREPAVAVIPLRPAYGLVVW